MENFKLKNRTAQIVLTKSGRMNKNIKHSFDVSGACSIKGGMIYPVITSGSGRFTSNQDHSHNIIPILKAQGYKWTTGNDAPRGGKTGNYIKVSKRAAAFLEWIYTNY